MNTVTAVPLGLDGTPQSSLATASWLDPVQYASGLTGGSIPNQIVLQANPPCASAVQWTVSIPSQQETHDNFDYNTLQIFTPKPGDLTQ